MARISVWYIRTALLHFALGASVGAWRLASAGGLWPELSFSLRSLHVEGMLLGWVCQLALGVALWILPFSDRVSADKRLWAAWGALNGGILLVIAGQVGMMSTFALIGRGFEIGAVFLILLVLWPRVRGVPRPDRDR